MATTIKRTTPPKAENTYLHPKNSNAHLIADMHTHFPNEIYTEKNWNRQNNIIIGIAIGVTIMICGVIYLVGMVMSS